MLRLRPTSGMTRPGAAPCHSCHVVTPYSEMVAVRSANGRRKYHICIPCRDRRRRLNLEAGGK